MQREKNGYQQYKREYYFPIESRESVAQNHGG